MSRLLERFRVVDFSTPLSRPIRAWDTRADGALQKVAFSPDAQYGAFLRTDRDVVVFKFEEMEDDLDAKIVDTLALATKVTFVSVAPKSIDTFLRGRDEEARRKTFGPSIDNYVLITGHANGNAAVWNIVSSMMVAKLCDHKDEITQIAYSPKPTKKFQLISASLDGTLKIWDFVATHSVTLAQTMKLPQALNAVSWSNSGTLVATGCKNGRVYVFRMDGVLKEKLYEFHNHNAACAAVQFAQDSSTLVSAGLDARVNVWDCITGGLRQTYCHLLPMPFFVYYGNEIKQAGIGRFGIKIVSVTQNRKLSVWDTRNANADCELVNTLDVPRLFQEAQKGLRVREDHSVIHGTESGTVGFTMTKGGHIIAVTPLHSYKVEFYKSKMDVPTLLELCRDAVRARAMDLTDRVHGLPLPPRLKAFLVYNDVNYD